MAFFFEEIPSPDDTRPTMTVDSDVDDFVVERIVDKRIRNARVKQ